MRARLLVAVLVLFVGTAFLTIPPTARAQSTKECSGDCKRQKKACDKGVKTTSKEAKAACGQAKKCKRVVKKKFRKGRKQCKKRFKKCSKCCKRTPLVIDCFPSLCGNGVVELPESCDAGNANSGDPGAPCREDCTRCGDQVVNPEHNEECDDGDPAEFPPNVANSNTRPDACRLNCTNPGCDDGVLDSGEQCDNGAANSDTVPCACRVTCGFFSCGDGVIDGIECGGIEQCDDGPANSNTTPDACRENCQNPRCGDGVIDPSNGEECDGSADPCPEGSRCRRNCFCASCTINGVLDAGEECEPGVDETACAYSCTDSCECFVPSTLAFTTVRPGEECGRINSAVDGTGMDLTPYGSDKDFLECGVLYIGGGISVQPPSPTPDNATTFFKVIDASDVTAVRLGPITAAQTGSERNCSAPPVPPAPPDAPPKVCFFGPPLPIPNPSVPAVSTCVFNIIDKRATGEEVSGTLDATTGATTVTLPLTVKVHVTGDLEDAPGIQPCPTCQGPMGATTCRSGQSVNRPCTTTNVLGTTHDCPPLPNTSLPNFGVDLTPLTTGRAVKPGPDGDFCTSTTGQRTLGCFGTNSGNLVCQYIEENGCPFYIDRAPGQDPECVATGADDLTTAGGNLRAIQASVFCIPSSGNMLVDTVADLPGPGAVTLTGVNKID